MNSRRKRFSPRFAAKLLALFSPCQTTRLLVCVLAGAAVVVVFVVLVPALTVSVFCVLCAAVTQKGITARKREGLKQFSFGTFVTNLNRSHSNSDESLVLHFSGKAFERDTSDPLA